MAPSVDLGLEALYPARRSAGGDDGVAHHPSGTADPSFTMSGTPVPTGGSAEDGFPPATSGPSGGSNTGAIAGGVVGAVAALALLAGLFLWWWRRRRTNAKNARVLKEKLDLDSEDHVDASAIPVPATHLALPPEKARPTLESISSPSDAATHGHESHSQVNRNLTASEELPRNWQVHNASSPSLQDAVVISSLSNEKNSKALSIPSSSSSSDPFASPISSPTTTSAGTFAFSHNGHTTEDSGSTTSPTSLDADDADSEIVTLRRRVTLLTQENARLSAAAQSILGIPSPVEAPPAYENRTQNLHTRNQTQQSQSIQEEQEV